MRRIFFIFLVLSVLLLFGTVLFISHNSAPVSDQAITQNFVINQGEGINSISHRLESLGFIRNQYVFILLSYKMRLNQKIQAGLFRLSPSLSSQEIIRKLSSGGSHDYWLKIIEGQRINELSIKFDKSLEGYIFPDSYLIPEGYTPDQIYQIIKKNFDDKLIQAKADSANIKLSDSQNVILASILEREGRSLKSKQAIAGVLLNRLSINMALQVDATVQYARDSRLSTKSYWLPVSKNDLLIDSPYNTYKFPGLPPSPICNPGYDSLYAAFHPVESDYTYYITGNDGKMYYAKTLEQHNQNIINHL